MFWILTLASASRDNLFPRPEDRLAAARLATRVALEVLLFCAVDDHFHLVVAGPRPVHLAGTLGRILARRAPMQAAHLKPVAGRRHLVTLVGYLLRQPAKHELGVHPALWEGSCFPDLVGARCIGFSSETLERALPRRPDRDYLTPVGLRTRPVPLPWAEVERLSPSRLVGAVAAAAGLTSLGGPRTADRVRARQAAAWMTRRAGVPAARTAALLGVSPRSVRRLRSLDAEPALAVAARTRLHLELLCGHIPRHGAA